jgi:hypothetical protein
VGHTAYHFGPADIARSVREYPAVNKDHIRKNCDSAAKHLGFVGRLMHGANPRTWLRELKGRIGQARTG